MCDEYADNQRKKSQVWPLQSTLLILCPVCGIEYVLCVSEWCSNHVHSSLQRTNQGDVD